MPPAERFRVASPPLERPLLIFDGDCAFCRLWIGRWRAVTGDRVDYAPSQEAAQKHPEIPRETFERTVVWVGTDGVALTGAEAALTALSQSPRAAWALALYRILPGAATASEYVYALIASRRRFFSRLTRALWGSSVLAPSYAVSRCLILRLMGLIYLAAFVSLWTQVDGLIGSRGILPVRDWIESMTRSGAGSWPGRLWLHPTLSWLDSGDLLLHVQCAAGALLGATAALGLAPAPVFLLLWLLYLSLTTACRTFLGFQWDNLLLEAGLLAILLSPIRWRCRLGCEAAPSRVPLLLTRWLVFRLMLSSGVVKLSSGDTTWSRLTALTYHYETQCLPPWTAWYAHQLPLWFQKLSCALMFAIELGAPFLILAPRRLRHFGAGALIGFQVLILITGNYGFFNLLSIALLLALLDDTVWPGRWRDAGRDVAARAGVRWPAWVLAPIAVPVAILGAVRLGDAFRVPLPWPAPVVWLSEASEPLRSVNWYGLFSVMTTRRPEIVVEGSDDGTNWKAYEFRWKPGDVNLKPRFFTPHMPRLDWLMWFAALGDYRSQDWFLPFLARLLEGSPDVIGLLATNPFPQAPPRYIRALVYDYHFTDAAERARTGAWWRRAEPRPYTPVFSRRGS